MSNTPWSSQIIMVSSGQLNTVNDEVIAGQASINSRSRFAGQLGKHLFVSQDQIAALTDTDVGDLFGGRYRYVRRRAEDNDSPAMSPGHLAFWDTTITNWQTKYQVTADENLAGQADATIRAGVFIGNIEPGNYGFICDLGIVDLMFRAVLTQAGAIGSPVYAAATGDTGSDQGTGDVLVTDSTSVANERFLGWAIEAPVGNTLKQVALSSDAFFFLG